jgi:uncharacterized HAD superfamily protein
MSVKIALDLDGIATDIITSFTKKAGNVSAEEVSKALFTKGGYEPFDHVFKDPLFWKNLKPIENSWHAINKWFYEGNDIYFITARSSRYAVQQIDKWLTSWSIPYNEYFVCDMMNKHRTLSVLGADIFIDDNPYEVQEVAKLVNEKKIHNIKSFAMKTWYNEHIVKANNINYISSLQELKIG